MSSRKYGKNRFRVSPSFLFFFGYLWFGSCLSRVAGCSSVPILFKPCTPGSHCAPHKRANDRVQHVSYGKSPPCSLLCSHLHPSLSPLSLSPPALCLSLGIMHDFFSFFNVKKEISFSMFSVADHTLHIQVKVHHGRQPIPLTV